MNTKDKKLALAKLMGWIVFYHIPHGTVPHLENTGHVLNPYDDLAQFAAILLKFPEVMAKFNSTYVWGAYYTEPTIRQAIILDEILRLNGENP